MRITLVISSLGPGGAERVMSYMASYWVEKGWSVTVITLSSIDSDFYAVDQRVTRVSLMAEQYSLNFWQAISHNYARFLNLRSSIKQSRPDIVISFIDQVNILTLLSTRLTKIPVIISERVDPRYHQIGWLWRVLRRLTYPSARALVVQSRSLSQWLRGMKWSSKVLVIPNPTIKPNLNNIDNQSIFPQPYILAVGRLNKQKGFDLLLNAYRLIANDFPDWSLIIVGEGPERASLESLSKKLNIADRVQFYGAHEQPMRVMMNASLFVLSSRFEGFPNVLLEAMSCGLPVVSFNCPSGPNEIIQDGINGVLVSPQNIADLASAMRELINHPEHRAQLGVRASEVAEQFSLDRVMAIWESLLLDIELTIN